MTIRVLHLIAGLDPRDGGPVSALIGLVNAQRAAGMDPAILTTKVASDEVVPTPNDIYVYTIQPNAKGRMKWSPGISPALMRHTRDFDVIHTHGTWEWIHYLGIGTAQRLRKPIFFRPCGMLDPWSLQQGSVAKRVWLMCALKRRLRRVTALHLATERESSLVASLGLGAPRVVVPNGVELSPRVMLHEADGGPPRLLFLGRLHEKKGVDLLLQAHAACLREGFASELTIAGDAESSRYMEELRGLAREGGSGHLVRFIGHVSGERKRAVLESADLLILPSYQENFGNVVVEAAAVGTPSLVSEQVYLADDLVAAGAGGVIPFNRIWPKHQLIESITTTMAAWISSPDLRREAAVRTPAFAARFDWSVIAQRWLSLYRQAVDGYGLSGH
ncbi:glycosyltransferase [bacterium]|nr:glycosyltransferase [bacterium]